MAGIYGTGAAIGFSPQQVDAMSIWQFQAAVNGYMAAHCPDDGKKLKASEMDDLWEAVSAKMGNA